MTALPFEIVHSEGLARVTQLDLGRPLITPTYFPAVSGASMSARPIDLIRLIIDAKYPRLLLSAYDVNQMNAKQRNWLRHGLHRFRAGGGFVFLDCGVFESYWLKDHRWNLEGYGKALRVLEADFYATFDGAAHTLSRQALASGFHPKDIAKSIEFGADRNCVLIAHAVSPGRLINAATTLLKFSLAKFEDRVAGLPITVAVPERECGTNVIERTRTLAAIRRALNRFEIPVLLHVLGCGFPVSMASYSIAGADSFDSRDWCEAAIDRRNFCATDFSLLSATGCSCRVCATFVLDNMQRGLLHNLLFYQTLCQDLQRMIREGTLRDFLLENLGASTFESLSAAIDNFASEK